MITEATTADWVDFWENEMPPEPISLDAKQLTTLKEEILEATQMYMAQNAPKAAMAMTGALYDPTELGIRDKMVAAKEMLEARIK